MHALRTADEPHRGDPVAEALQRLVRRLKHRGMIGEPEIVVRAEIDHLAPIGEPHDRALGRADDALALQEAVVLECPSVALEPFAEFFEHHGLWKFRGLNALLYRLTEQEKCDGVRMKPDEEAESHRLDKWLWYARFYKTRSLATAAIDGGKVHLNAERVKPAHRVRVGDRLSLSLQGIVAEFGGAGTAESAAVPPPKPNPTISRPRKAPPGARMSRNSTSNWRKALETLPGGPPRQARPAPADAPAARSGT